MLLHWYYDLENYSVRNKKNTLHRLRLLLLHKLRFTFILFKLWNTSFHMLLFSVGLKRSVCVSTLAPAPVFLLQKHISVVLKLKIIINVYKFLFFLRLIYWTWRILLSLWGKKIFSGRKQNEVVLWGRRQLTRDDRQPEP